MSYPRYPTYRDSGVAWLGDIPEHWDVKRLKYIAPLASEKLVRKPLDLIYLGLEHIESGTGRILELQHEIQVESTVAVFDKNDVLFGKLRPYLAKVTIAPCEGVSTTELIVLRPSQGTVEKFLMYQLLNQTVITELDSTTYGAKMPRVSPEYIANFRLPVPPLAEQRAIADFLDRETERIDTLIAKQTQLINLLEEKRSVLISHTVTQGLDPSVPRKDSGEEWLGNVPAHWEIQRIKTAIVDIKNGIWGSEPEKEGEGIICIRVADFDRSNFAIDHSDFTYRSVSDQEKASRLLKPGDLLIEKSGGGDLQPVGFVVIYEGADEAITSNFIARIRLKEGVHPRYMLYIFASLYSARVNVRSIKQTTGIQNIDTGAYFDERVCLPPLTEQRAIVAYLERETAQIDELLHKARSAIDLLRERRSALISAAVTGALDVREV